MNHRHVEIGVYVDTYEDILTRQTFLCECGAYRVERAEVDEDGGDCWSVGPWTKDSRWYADKTHNESTIYSMSPEPKHVEEARSALAWKTPFEVLTQSGHVYHRVWTTSARSPGWVNETVADFTPVRARKETPENHRGKRRHSYVTRVMNEQAENWLPEGLSEVMRSQR